MRIRLALACIAAVAGLTATGLAQTTAPKAKTEAQFAGGFRPDACRWPKGARAKQLSACCQMDLQIDAQGRMVTSSGYPLSAGITLPPETTSITVSSSGVVSAKLPGTT